MHVDPGCCYLLATLVNVELFLLYFLQTFTIVFLDICASFLKYLKLHFQFLCQCLVNIVIFLLLTFVGFATFLAN